MEITKRVTITVAEKELVGLIVKAISPDVKEATGQEWTLYRALSGLVGCTDVEAVRKANSLAREYSCPMITTGEFRKWLPQVLSIAFAKLLDVEVGK